MFLKRFFYASASILMLALAYHFGAGTAGAQSPAGWVVGFGGTNASMPIVGVGNRVYWYDFNSRTVLPAGDYPRTVVGIGNNVVVLDNGDFYVDGALAGSYSSVLPGSPTPAAQRTFGQLKVQYRK